MFAKIFMVVKLTNSFLKDESGQGITEYGAMVAFVGMLIALVFSGSHGTLSMTIQNSFSSVAHGLNSLSSSS